MRTENLQVPKGPVDMVLDTDAYNEIDDQFAIAYALRSADKLNLTALYAAPFFNAHSSGPRDGMEKSYDEILKLLALAGEKRDVFRGSETYLPDEKTPVLSDAARDLAERAMHAVMIVSGQYADAGQLNAALMATTLEMVIAKKQAARISLIFQILQALGHGLGEKKGGETDADSASQASTPTDLNPQ